MTSQSGVDKTSGRNQSDVIQAERASSSWQEIAARKRGDRDSRMQVYSHWSLGDLLPPSSQKNVSSLVHARLTERERSFLSSDVTSLVDRLATKECSAVEVTTAFCKAAYAAQELTNCLSEVMFASALARAKELDNHLAETGQLVGPLHGVPISIKDHISVKGEDTAAGVVAWIGKRIAEEDADIVRILRTAGAVIYVKTANPQAVLCIETQSNVYGTTTNPFNRDLTSGGSSGGECSLIGCRGGLIGVGSDIGGSIRIPSAATGLYGLKPSSQRLPVGVFLEMYKGMDNFVGAVGPMAHSARDLELFCRVISHYKPWETDHYTLRMPWSSEVALNKDESLPKRLVIGLVCDDTVVAPHPPIIARLNKTRDALLAAGHEVIDWEPMDQFKGIELAGKLLALDGGKIIRDALNDSGEPAIPILEGALAPAEQAGPRTLAQSWELNAQRNEFRNRALRHWNATAALSVQSRPVDAVLTPVAATLAPPHGTSRWLGYTFYWNLLDQPAVVFPSGKPFDATTWDPSQGPELPAARNPLEEFVHGQWCPETYHGAPVGLQLVGSRLQEENLLAVLSVVEEAVSRFEQ